MYASRTTQLFVGIFTLIGIAALVFLSVRLGRVEIIPTPGYTLFANFDNIAGLKTGDQVEIAGVKIGKVTGDRARRTTVRTWRCASTRALRVDSDAIASILTSGLIGDKYVSIALGAGDDLEERRHDPPDAIGLRPRERDRSLYQQWRLQQQERLVGRRIERRRIGRGRPERRWQQHAQRQPHQQYQRPVQRRVTLKEKH